MQKVKIKYTVGEKIGLCFFLEDIKTEEVMYARKVYLRRAKFRCHCGNEFENYIHRVKSLYVKSCGCMRNQNTNPTGKGPKAKHMCSINGKTSEYMAWDSMKQRCYNQKCGGFEEYGGRGIKVCSSWLESFNNFLQDVGTKPSPKHSLDRIDVNGDYEPGNCRWATSIEQANNRRNNNWIEYNGEVKTITTWANALNISTKALKCRIKNWGMEKAFIPKLINNGN